MPNITAENLCDLAKELKGLFAQKSMTKTVLDRLYHDIEQTYISALRASVLDGHPQWCVHSQQRAMELYLYQNWPHENPDTDLPSQLNFLVQQMEQDFLPAKGDQLSLASIEKILYDLDQQDCYSEKVL